MPATRSKSSAAMKQGKLQFAAIKRTNSSSQETKAKSKKKTPVQAEESSPEAAQRESVESKLNSLPAAPEELPPPREQLKVKDPRWKKVIQDAKDKNDNLTPSRTNMGRASVYLDWSDGLEHNPWDSILRLRQVYSLQILQPSQCLPQIRDILLTQQGIEKTEYAESCLYGQL
ncbi:hypothetical protein AAF712_004441 [Marasmius tenuissimus]|uniref:Uncharacterized protein n=1 Tax=Marasmius tenuissimus TaxID=585030 RepID=A0ABR3A445_9AGAR